VTPQPASVPGQWLGEHVPVAREQIPNKATVVLQQCKRVSTSSMSKCYKQGTKSVENSVAFSTGCCEERT
jgi:hypothetical protein